MSLSKGSNRNTAKETHLNERNFDSFNTNNNERYALFNRKRIIFSSCCFLLRMRIVWE